MVIPTKYRIVDVAEDYSWALVDYPGRDLAWVFVRDPELDESTYAMLAQKLRSHRPDLSVLERVPQRREQLGRPGFGTAKKN